MTEPAVDSERLLEGLDDQQRVAAETLLGPVCLLAGAGTGKTRAITHRIAYGIATGVYSPSRVMALTFTARAASELRSRLRVLGAGSVAARTFHASALSQLGFFWPQAIGGSMPSLLDSKARLLAHAADSVRLKLDTATLRDMSAEIEWRKVSKLSIEQYGQRAASRGLPPSITPEKAVDLLQAYENLKDDRRQLDFEDVLLATAGMLESEPAIAAQVREQYRFFVVDEYQDVSPLQHDLLRLWLGGRNDVCVVGDASQTIYSFAGARPDYLLGFGSEYEDAVVLRLEHNYRSATPIVEAANRLMRDRPGALQLRSVTGVAGTRPPRVTVHANDSQEARAAAQSIAAEIEAGTAPENIAVLYRVNAQAAAVEAALTDAGVSSRLHGGTRFFDQREVKEAIMLLRGATMGSGGDPLFKTVSDVLRTIGWTQEAPEGRGAVRDRWEALDALMTMAEQAAEGTTLAGFVAELVERQKSHHEPPLAAVTLASLHSAKGLEWDSVYIVGASEGLLPISYATTEEAVEEERRLLYVGVTRARRKLSISWSEDAGHRGGRRRASRFLAELER